MYREPKVEDVDKMLRGLSSDGKIESMQLLAHSSDGHDGTNTEFYRGYRLKA